MIGVVLPAYNAAGTVAGAASAARRHLPDVLVVDDGSSDDTCGAARSAGVEVIRHPANRGKGAALATGFSAMLSRGAEAVITLDADLQHDADDIPRFIESWTRTGADLIVGSRRESFTAMSPGRRLGNRFSSGALRFFTGMELPDSQSGFRLYGASFLRAIRLRRRAYDAEMEALMEAARLRRRVVTIPITVHEADGCSTSSYRPWLDTYRICRTVVLHSITTW